MKLLKLVPAILLAVAALRAQEAPKTVCGTDIRTPEKNIELVAVGCIDFDALAKQAPGWPWRAGKVTQVLVHVKAGDRVYISVDGGKTYRRQKLVLDQYGRLIALVEFEGGGYTALDVDVVPGAVQE